jgi:rhodanese-related sulfurtransferase
VARRVDVLAMAIQLGGTVYDLEEAELCYAPQFGAAKDAVNMAGMLAANRLRGDFPSTTWAEVGNHVGPLVDVREPHEFADGHVDNAINLPLSELRDRLDELPRDADVVVYCHSGKRSYDAVRMLAQRGFSARSVLGGMMSKEHHQP